MNHVLTLSQAARHIHIDENELKHLAQRGEISTRRRGEDYFFEHQAIDEWAQTHIVSLSPRKLGPWHKSVIQAQKKRIEEDGLIESLLKPEWILPRLGSRTRPGVIRDMVALSLSTGFLYDDVVLQRGVEAREEQASTAIGEGAAFLHQLHLDPYCASASFITLGRTEQPIFFGAQDGKPTDLFFLICCIDCDQHLHALARLCLMMHGTDLPLRLREASTAEEMYQCLLDAEHEFLRTF